MLRWNSCLDHTFFLLENAFEKNPGLLASHPEK